MGKHRPAGNEGRSRMWQSMRILRLFTIDDLAATAVVSRYRASGYIRILAERGYVARAQKHKPGQGTSYGALWVLKRDTGPFPPRRARKALIDPNLDPTQRETHISIPRSEYERALKCVRACAGLEDPETAVAELKRLAGAATR